MFFSTGCKRLVTLALFLSAFTQAADTELSPNTNDGQRWRIGYVEGGPYIDYQQEFRATVRELMKRGWIEPAELPPETGEGIATTWRWLATQAESGYLAFVPDAHYSAGWDEAQRQVMVGRLQQRLNTQKDIDVMLALGTWAGVDMATDRHHTPTFVISTSDPLDAGIINSATDSGYPHLHATVNPMQFYTQVKMFHELVSFKTLGIAYENTPLGRSYAALTSVNKVAQEKGFDIVACHTLSDTPDIPQAEQSLRDCFKELAPKVDAIYVTLQGGLTPNSLPSLVETAITHRVPTFSQDSRLVEGGLLYSVARTDFDHLGQVNANNLTRFFYGSAPGSIPLVYEEPFKISINLITARAINYEPPILLFSIADQIFDEI